MILQIARREMVLQFRDGRMRLALWVLLAALFAACVSGWLQFNQAAGEQSLFEEQARQQWLTQGERHPHRAAHFGTYVTKPELSLAFFEPGLRPFAGQTLWLEAHDRPAFANIPAEDDLTLTLGPGAAGGAAILQMLGGLLALCMGALAVASDRESGVLRQILAQGTDIRTWLAGKALGLSGVLAIPVGVAGALMFVGALFGAPAGLKADTAIRAGILLLTNALLLWTLLAIGVGISAITASTRAALTAALAVWIGGFVLAPRLAATLAERLAPSPTVAEYRAAASKVFDEGFDSRGGYSAQLTALENKTMQRYGATKLEDLPVGFSGIRMKHMDGWSAEVDDREYARLQRTYQRQFATRMGVALLAPFLAARSLAQGMAGTDWSHYQHFLAAAAALSTRIRESDERPDRRSRARRTVGNGWNEYGLGGRRAASLPPSAYRLGPDSTGCPGTDSRRLGQRGGRSVLRVREQEAAHMSANWITEWRLFIRGPASVLMLSVFAALTVIGALNGVQRVVETRRLVSQAVADDAKAFAVKRAALVELEAGRTTEGQFGSPRKAHQAVLSAARPLVPSEAELPVLSSGPRPTPELLRVSILTRHVDQQPRLDDPSNRLDGAFDLVFVTTWLLPLFALVLGCDVLSGDRERGRAALLASQGTSLGAILGGRLLLRYAALLGVVSIVAVAAVVATEVGGSCAILGSLGVWLLGVALFLAFWFALAAAVNAFSGSAATAALALLCLWVGFSVVIPALAGSAVQSWAPPPDRLKGVLTLRDLDADLNRRRAEVTAAYYAAAPQNEPVREGDEYEHYFVTELYPRHLAFDLAYAPTAARMDAARVKQAELLRVAGVFSPTLAFRLLTEDLAGAAPERRLAFLQAADEFQLQWRRHFDHKLASMRPLTVADYDGKPEFTAPSEPATVRWYRVVLMMGPLLMLGAAAFIFALGGARAARHLSGAH